MAANTIDSTEFATMRGRPIGAAILVDRIDVAGVDYVATRERGLRCPEVEIVTDSFHATVGAADGVAEDCLAMKGTEVTITDAHGVEHENVLIVDMVPIVRACLHGSDTAHLRCRWLVQKNG